MMKKILKKTKKQKKRTNSKTKKMIKRILLTIVVIISITLVTQGQDTNDSLLIAKHKAQISSMKKAVTGFQTQLAQDPSVSFPRESQILILNLFSQFITSSSVLGELYEDEVKDNQRTTKELEFTTDQLEKMGKLAEKLIKENEALKKNQSK